jgi:hypothetical protein
MLLCLKLLGEEEEVEMTTHVQGTDMERTGRKS